MSSSTIVAPVIKLRSASGNAGNTARKIVYKLLQNISRGRLVVQRGEEIIAFGEDQSRADLIAHVHVHDDSVYRAILLHGTVGAGESYMEGAWSSPDLVKVIRVLTCNMSLLRSMNKQSSLWHKLGSRLQHSFSRNNNRRGSRRNIGAHYDLSNEFFALFLDPCMMYSSAVYTDQIDDLDRAAVHKMDQICRRLQLQPTDHLLEIGTGWGSLAIHAARHFGCRVTTTTISSEQFDYAREAVIDAGLSHRVTVLKQDYRELRGRFDKLVSIEMIEAVGHRYYSNYFQQCSQLLANDGLMLIQAITIPDQRYDSARRSVDFIQKYIFPGGALPSLGTIATHVARDTDMQIIDLQDIGRDYAKTLREWRERFTSRLDQVRDLGFDEQFIRMWEFYLAYCEGGFQERVISTAQITLAKPGYRGIDSLDKQGDTSSC